MHPMVVERLLAFRPFARFKLYTATKEYEILEPRCLKVFGDIDLLVWSDEGTTDFIDLRLVERIAIDDDFGFAELERFWK